MFEQVLLLIASLFLLVQGATLATRYSAYLAHDFGLPKHTVGFIIVALIAILPETLISINAALAGVPELGLGTLLGSNVADLTLIFALLILLTKRSIAIESKVLQHVRFYPVFLALPIFLGADGHLSRLDGVLLIAAGLLFYYLVYQSGVGGGEKAKRGKHQRVLHVAMLLFAVVLLLAGAHLTVAAATTLAEILGVVPILLGLLVVSLGTTMPELFYSLKALQSKEDSLAVGDILGSVLADATIVIGILAVIAPFTFPVQIMYVSGAFMVLAAVVLLGFMRSQGRLTKREGMLLFILWVLYAVIELVANW